MYVDENERLKANLSGKPFPGIIAKLAVLTIVVLGVSGIVRANENVGPSGATIEFSRSPSALIVSYALHLGEIAESDRGPTVQIYGDGLAHVHYPAYMTRAGDYGLQLSDDEMTGLLDSLVADGVLEFDPSRARATVREIDMLRRENARVKHHVSDPSTSVIEIHLVRYSPPGASSVQAVKVNKTIRWSGLQSDARLYPNHVVIQNLAAAEQRLRDLMERPDLIRADARNRETPSRLRQD